MFIISVFSQAPAPKIPLNQLAGKAPSSSTPAPSVLQPSTVSTVTHPPPVSAVSGSMTTTVTTPTKAEIQPLTDVFVALESIQPGKLLYFILYSETQCISKLDKIGIFIDMKFHCYQISLISKVTSD